MEGEEGSRLSTGLGEGGKRAAWRESRMAIESVGVQGCMGVRGEHWGQRGAMINYTNSVCIIPSTVYTCAV